MRLPLLFIKNVANRLTYLLALSHPHVSMLLRLCCISLEVHADAKLITRACMLDLLRVAQVPPAFPGWPLPVHCPGPSRGRRLLAGAAGGVQGAGPGQPVQRRAGPAGAAQAVEGGGAACAPGPHSRASLSAGELQAAPSGASVWFLSAPLTCGWVAIRGVVGGEIAACQLRMCGFGAMESWSTVPQLVELSREIMGRVEWAFFGLYWAALRTLKHPCASRTHGCFLGRLPGPWAPGAMGSWGLFVGAFAGLPCVDSLPLRAADSSSEMPQDRNWAEEQALSSCWMAAFGRSIFRGRERAREGRQQGGRGRTTGGKGGDPDSGKAVVTTGSTIEQRSLLIQALGCLEHQAEQRQARLGCAGLSSSSSVVAGLPAPAPHGSFPRLCSAPLPALPASASHPAAARAALLTPRPGAPPSCQQLDQHWLRGTASLVQPGQGDGGQEGVLDEANMESVSISSPSSC